jgi:hypothetical protein
MTVLHYPEEVNCKTTAHVNGIAYIIDQEALPARRVEQFEYMRYSRNWRRKIYSATRGAKKVRVHPDNDHTDRAGDRDCSSSELTRTASQCVSVQQ